MDSFKVTPYYNIIAALLVSSFRIDILGFLCGVCMCVCMCMSVQNYSVSSQKRKGD